MFFKFSIVIPLYNKEKYVESCLDSIVSQSYSNFEIIIINDGSTDNSIDRVNAFKSRNKNVELLVFEQQNSGVSASRNFGIEKSRGEFVCFLDADDYWHPQYLEVANHIINKEVDCNIIGTKFGYIKERKEILNLDSFEVTDVRYRSTSYIKEVINNGSASNSSSTIVKRILLLDSSFKFDEKQTHAEDIDVWTRLSFRYSMYFVEEVLSFYDLSDSNSATSTKQYLNWSNIFRTKSVKPPAGLEINDVNTFVFNLKLRYLFSNLKRKNFALFLKVLKSIVFDKYKAGN
ncbi:MAG: glycosyltransferase family 2 protein [Pseudoalteromonas nigrifaciens]